MSVGWHFMGKVVDLFCSRFPQLPCTCGPAVSTGKSNRRRPNPIPGRAVKVAVQQLLIKAGWLDAPLELQDFSWSNKRVSNWLYTPSCFQVLAETSLSSIRSSTFTIIGLLPIIHDINSNKRLKSCPPGNRTGALPVGHCRPNLPGHKYVVAAGILLDSKGNIKLMKCHPTDVSISPVAP